MTWNARTLLIINFLATIFLGGEIPVNFVEVLNTWHMSYPGPLGEECLYEYNGIPRTEMWVVDECHSLLKDQSVSDYKWNAGVSRAYMQDILRHRQGHLN